MSSTPIGKLVKSSHANLESSMASTAPGRQLTGSKIYGRADGRRMDGCIYVYGGIPRDRQKAVSRSKFVDGKYRGKYLEPQIQRGTSSVARMQIVSLVAFPGTGKRPFPGQSLLAENIAARTWSRKSSVARPAWQGCYFGSFDIISRLRNVCQSVVK